MEKDSLTEVTKKNRVMIYFVLGLKFTQREKKNGKSLLKNKKKKVDQII